MSQSRDDFAAWASIIGSGATVLGLLQSYTWLAILGLTLAILSAVALLYAWNARSRLARTTVHLEGLNIDSLNIANLRRRLNRSLFVQHASHRAVVYERDLHVAWQYEGYCRSKRETTIEFSIDTENNIPFSDLDCFAFDLHHDPQRQHRIRPLLVGADGLSKKIAVPFLHPLSPQQPFNIMLNCSLPGCVGTGVQYYTASLSFAQPRIHMLRVQLYFVETEPDWVRVYECDSSARPTLISELRPRLIDGETREYVDLVEQVPGEAIRIYVYQIPKSPRAMLLTN